MSGVFSIASHCALQYFSDVTLQLHIGCAHFFMSAMFTSLICVRNRIRALLLHPARFELDVYSRHYSAANHPNRQSGKNLTHRRDNA